MKLRIFLLLKKIEEKAWIAIFSRSRGFLQLSHFLGTLILCYSFVLNIYINRVWVWVTGYYCWYDVYRMDNSACILFHLPTLTCSVLSTLQPVIGKGEYLFLDKSLKHINNIQSINYYYLLVKKQIKYQYFILSKKFISLF